MNQLSKSDRLIQFIIGILRSRLTPILATVVAGLLSKWVAADPAGNATSNLDAAQITAVVVSVVLAGITMLLTWVVRLLTKHVKAFQILLSENSSTPVGGVDGWFGERSLKEAVKAINTDSVKVTGADVSLAKEEAGVK